MDRTISTQRAIKQSSLLLAIAIWLALPASLAFAQTTANKLVVGWSEITPLFIADRDGGPAGFGAEIISEIAKRAGFEIEFRKFDKAEAMIEAQAAGETDLLPAIAALPFLQAQNEFSAPVAETNIRVFVRAEDIEKLKPSTMAGVRIARPSIPLGPEGQSLLDRNLPVDVPVGTLSIMALLRGDVDALIAADSVTIADAHELRLDHRIVAVGQPIQQFPRIIAVNRSHQELIGPINSAIEAMEADGTLTNLRQVRQISMPPPAPQILSVGVYHFPPYNVVNDDGTFTGFSVETIRNLAELAGLKLSFTEITREEWGQGPAPGRYDMITQAGISADRLQRMDFTLPVQRTEIAIFTSKERADEITGLAALAGRLVGVEEVNLGRRLADRHGGMDLRVFKGQEALLQALQAGGVDAIIFPPDPIRGLLKAQQTTDIVEIAKPAFVVERAPALRFGLGEVRERLNAVIPGYLISDANTQLLAAWFSDTPVWTKQRVAWLIGGVTIAVGLIIAGLIGFTFLEKRRALNERRRFASELIENMPLGVALISPEGRIDFANRDMKERTPDVGPLFDEGREYRATIQTLAKNGWFQLNGKAPEELVTELAHTGLQDGFEQEYHLTNGTVFQRRTKRLSSGGTLIMRQDVTEERRRTREVQELNRKLQYQIDIAQAANDELRTFAYSTSHDLKAPANTVRLLADALAENLQSKIDADDQELLDDLRSTTSRMSQVIEDVLDYTYIIGAELVFDDVDLSSVLDEVLDDLRADIDASKAVITHSSLPAIKANAPQIRQLFLNLVSNAIKFHKPDEPPIINISTNPDADGLVSLAVSDRGIGIDPQFHQKIFQLFSRLHTTNSYPGTGLGLSICQRIARNHGGQITLSSTPGVGTTFTVTLQVDQKDQHDQESLVD